MIFTCTLDYPFTLHVELFSVQNRSRNLTPKSIWFCCLLSFFINCFQISLLRISDPILYFRKDFLSLRFSDQNICETIFICTLDCPFRLEFYMPFVSGSQIGFVLTIYEKVLKNISIRNFLKVFNCHTKKP